MDSYVAFHYQGLWILAVLLVMMVVIYFLMLYSNNEKVKSWIPYLLAFCILLLIGFLMLNYFSKDAQLEENMEMLMERMPDNAQVYDKDVEIPLSDMFEPIDELKIG